MKRVVKYVKSKQVPAGLGYICNHAQVMSTVNLWLETVQSGEYTIEMKKVQEKRSISQNKLLWVWFSAIADAWSEATDRSFTRNDVHDAYCLMFLPVDTPKGRVGGSTSGLTVEQMSEFMEKVQADAANDGIVLLNPEDKFFDEWAAQYEGR